MADSTSSCVQRGGYPEAKTAPSQRHGWRGHAKEIRIHFSAAAQFRTWSVFATLLIFCYRVRSGERVKFIVVSKETLYSRNMFLLITQFQFSVLSWASLNLEIVSKKTLYCRKMFPLITFNSAFFL